MIQTAVQSDRTAGWTLTFSLALHLLAILVFANTDIFRPRLIESIPYYVDIVSLPSPDPAPAGSEASAPAPPPPAPAILARQPAAAQKPVMSLPAKQPPAVPLTTSPTTEQRQRAQEAREFSERMSRLEQNSDARHESEALASLQKRVSKKKAGLPTASGIDTGSDYGAYIQSRLKDALSSTMVYRSQKPEAAVQIYIDSTGKLIRYVMVRPSSDKLFNNSVIRTIEKAKAEFPPVPSGRGFDKLYVFSPQEVKN
jgi:TonB family protein